MSNPSISKKHNVICASGASIAVNSASRFDHRHSKYLEPWAITESSIEVRISCTYSSSTASSHPSHRIVASPSAAVPLELVVAAFPQFGRVANRHHEIEQSARRPSARTVHAPEAHVLLTLRAVSVAQD